MTQSLTPEETRQKVKALVELVGNLHRMDRLHTESLKVMQLMIDILKTALDEHKDRLSKVEAKLFLDGVT